MEYQTLGGDFVEFDPQSLFQQIYGRQGSPDELAAVGGMSPDQISGVLTQSLANFNAQQAQIPYTDVSNVNLPNPTLAVMGGNASTQTNTTTPTSIISPPVLSAEEKNFIDWQLAQRPDPFTTPGGYATFADFYQARGIDPYGPEGKKFAQESLAKLEPVSQIREQYMGVPYGGNEWENPNWQTVTALERAATEAQRVQGANTPSPFSIGPGGPAQPQNLTLDPMYASILGGVDPITVQRAVNLMKYGANTYKQSGIDSSALALANAMKGKSLPQATLEKLFPSYAQAAAATPTSTAPTSTTPAGTTPASTQPPAPTSTASGKFVTDYQGNQFDTGTTMALAKQIASNFDKGSSGAAFTTKGESIGFDYDQAKEILGKDPNAIQQVVFDMSRYLQQAGVTDLNQIGVRQSGLPYYNEQGNIEGYTQGREFYNKETGQAIPDQFGQTYTGKGGTAYFLAEKDGKIGVQAKGFDTSDAGLVAPLLMAASFMMPVIAPGLQSAIAGAVPAAGAAGSLGNVALTNALTSGAMAGLTGGDPLKAALLGGASPFISSGIGSVLPTDFVKSNPAIAKFLTNTGTSAVTSALSGKDFDLGQSLQNSLMSGIAGQAMSKAGIPADLAPLLVSLAKSGTISPQAVMQMMSQMSAKKGT